MTGRINWIRNRLAPFYRRFPPRLSPNIVDSRIAVSRDLSYCYFRIPKAANSTIIASLNRASFSGEQPSRYELRLLKTDTYLRPSRLARKDLDRLLQTTFKFT